MKAKAKAKAKMTTTTETALGREWHHLPRCGSTNDEALRLGRAGAPHGTVITAEAQERGRGRQGRRWHSPPGENLYASVLLRPPLLPAQAPFLTLCAGVALAEAVAAEMRDTAAPELALKWPNDLLLAGRKLAGILLEMACTGARLDFVVMGIGVNLNGTGFPEELRGRATSLRLALGRRVQPLGFLDRLLAGLEEVYQLYLTDGPARVLGRYADYATFLLRREPMQVRSGGGVLRGVPLGLAEDGALLLCDERSTVHRVLAGEIDL